MSTCDETTAAALKEQATIYNQSLAKTSISAQAADFIAKAQGYLACDPECERKKTEASLLTDYQNAQMSLFTGPESLASTSKNYYTFAKGSEGYNEFNAGKLGDVADQITAKYSSAFNEIVNTSEVLNNVYQSDFTNVRHAKELYETLGEKNDDMDTKLKDTLNDISTSDRKSYYEDQELDNLRWWYNIYLVIYIICLLTFVISSIFTPTEMSIRSRVAIIVFLGLYIYLAKYVAVAIIKLWMYITSFFPKNVYLSI